MTGKPAKEANLEDDGEASSIYDALSQEFSNERALVDGETNRNAQLESVYSRVTGISGRPLTDGYHFGQTILNDFGRPFGVGFNTVDGFSGFASEGPLIGYIRGEYQHAPSIPAPSAQALQFIATSFGSLPASVASSVFRPNKSQTAPAHSLR
jgi:hypothetical protein